MINTFDKKNTDKTDAGRAAFDYTVGKFRRIALPYWISVVFFLTAYIIHKGSVSVLDCLTEAIPELFAVTASGLFIQYNAPLWYISAMLIAILPLAFMLIKNRDWFIYVFSPIASLLLLGFMYSCEFRYIAYNDFFSVLTGGVIRAVCGLCFGAVSHIICGKLISLPETRFNTALITIAELFCSFLFFRAWFSAETESETLFAAMLMIPFIIGAAFSERSLVSRLFKAKWLKFSGPLSFAIYINHWTARTVTVYMGIKGFGKSVVCMALVTAVLCILNSLAAWLIRSVIKPRNAVSDTENTEESKSEVSYSNFTLKM